MPTTPTPEDERLAEKKRLVQICTATHSFTVFATLGLTGLIGGGKVILFVFLYLSVVVILFTYGKYRKSDEEFGESGESKAAKWSSIAVPLAVVGWNMAFGSLTLWMIIAAFVVVFVMYYFVAQFIGSIFFQRPPR